MCYVWRPRFDCGFFQKFVWSVESERESLEIAESEEEEEDDEKLELRQRQQLR